MSQLRLKQLDALDQIDVLKRIVNDFTARTGQPARSWQQLAAAGATVLPDTGAPPSAVVVPKITTTTVSRGDSLWRLSQATYGAGMRYAVIYKANRGQIRNPNRIYPGQIFVLPKADPGG